MGINPLDASLDIGDRRCAYLLFGWIDEQLYYSLRLGWYDRMGSKRLVAFGLWISAFLSGLCPRLERSNRAGSLCFAGIVAFMGMVGDRVGLDSISKIVGDRCIARAMRNSEDRCSAKNGIAFCIRFGMVSLPSARGGMADALA